MDILTNKQMDGWMHACMHQYIEKDQEIEEGTLNPKQTDGWMHTYMHACINT
jgi:hypothetical protein